MTDKTYKQGIEDAKRVVREYFEDVDKPLKYRRAGHTHGMTGAINALLPNSCQCPMKCEVCND